MNSADQGVFPLKTAFKRCWDFEYLGIDNKEAVISGKLFTFRDGVFEWNAIRKAINTKILENGVNEDKMLVPFFVLKLAAREVLNTFIRGDSIHLSEMFEELFAKTAVAIMANSST